jgi:hypothetical protein
MVLLSGRILIVIGILSFAKIKSFVMIEPEGRFSMTQGIASSSASVS